MFCAILLKLMGISGCGQIILLKKTFNFEKNFQLEKIAVGCG